MTEETVMFSMRIPRTIKRDLDGAANRDRRSTASLITLIVESWLEGKLYNPGFDRSSLEFGELDALAADLRPIPGRPRRNRKARVYTGHVRPILEPFLNGRDRVTMTEIFENTPARDDPGIQVMLRELLIEMGWKEYQNALGERVWVKLPA